MPEAYSVAAVRTAGGKRNGRVSGWHPVDMAARAIDELVARTGADPARLNVHGGAIALGHRLGASATKPMTTLVSALHQRGERYGLQTMCEGGGTANVTIVERLR